MIMALISGVFAGPAPMRVGERNRISGIGYYAEAGTCNDDEGQGASYVLSMTGSLSGCQYVFVETFAMLTRRSLLRVGN
jgi:hypothetical protein